MYDFSKIIFFNALSIELVQQETILMKLTKHLLDSCRYQVIYSSLVNSQAAVESTYPGHPPVAGLILEAKKYPMIVNCLLFQCCKKAQQWINPKKRPGLAFVECTSITS